MKITNVDITLPFLFINLNMLNVLDKTITWVALKNPKISELNPIVQHIINIFGIGGAMLIYSLFGFILLYIVYKVVTMKRLYCEKNNMSPEIIFMGLNIIFYFIVVNNISQILYNL